MQAKKQHTYCMVCGKEKTGISVKEDYVIDFIRWFKKTVLRSESHNLLVVCEEDYPVYKKYRKRFVSRQRIYIVLGALFVIFGMIIAPFITTLLWMLALLLFLYLLSLINYVPALDLMKYKEGKKTVGKKKDAL